MTSANLINISNGAGNQSIYTTKKGVKAPEASDKDFKKMLMGTAKNSIKDSEDTGVKGNDNPVKKTEVKDDKSTLSQDQSKTQAKNPIKEKTETDGKKDIKEEDLKDAADEFEKKTRKALKEAFDIEDKDIDSALFNLSLLISDLTDKKDLSSFVNLLSGEEDSVNLLLDGSVKDALSAISEFSKELSDTLEMPLGEIRDALKELSLSEEDNNILPEVSLELTGEDEPVLFTSENEKAVRVDEDKPVSVNEKSPASLNEIKEENQGDTVLQPENKGEIKDISALDEKNVKGENREVNEKTKIRTEEKEESDTVLVKENIESEGSYEETGENQGENPLDKGNKNPVNENRNPLFELNQNQIEQGASFEEDLAKNTENIRPEAEAPIPERYSDINTTDIINQIAEHARTNITEESQSLEMILNPEHLGRLYMEVSHKNGEVSARLLAENENVKAALEQQMEKLQESLSNQGYKIESVEVSVGTHEFERNLEEGQMQEESRRENEEEQRQSENSGNRNINLNDDSLLSDMTEEEELRVRMMQESGNTLNFTA